MSFHFTLLSLTVVLLLEGFALPLFLVAFEWSPRPFPLPFSLVVTNLIRLCTKSSFFPQLLVLKYVLGSSKWNRVRSGVSNDNSIVYYSTKWTNTNDKRDEKVTKKKKHKMM